MEFSSEAATLLPNGEGNSSVHTCTQTHSRSHSCTDKNRIQADETTQICLHFHIHGLVLSFSAPSPFAPLQRFPAYAVYLSWYIQSMNTQSQQVWTQLLNIQPCVPSCSPFLLPPLSSPTLNSDSPPSLAPILLCF